METHQEVAIVIPAKNEENTISEIVRSFSGVAEVILVNDCSIDRTEFLASENGAFTISNKQTLGYEKSIEIGLKTAYERGYKFAITMDADGQHSSEDAMKIINFFYEGFDLILGKRDKCARISEYIFKFFSKIIWEIDDPLCGLKGYNLALSKQMNFFNAKDSMGSFLAIKLIFRKVKFKEISVKINNRIDSPRMGNWIISEIKILQALINTFISFYKIKKK